MSGQTGFNYEVMLSRLHGGLCAFQSLRAHRRQRAQGVAPASTTEVRAVPEERVTSSPPRTVPLTHIDEQATGSPEPQAFVAVGDRVVPQFGNLSGLFGVPSVPSTPGSTASTPPVAPPVAPAPSAEEIRPPRLATAPAPTAATLKLPPPMPPPRLGLIYGGHPPAPEPVVATEPSTAPRTPIHDPPQDAAQAQESPSVASITTLLDARAQADVHRLEKANADHRAAMEVLLREHRDELCAQGEADVARTTQMLREHRDELRAQREADAARTVQLLREVLAEHRAELARAAQQHHADSHAIAGGTGELRAGLLEQASLQREANADVADQLSALTTIVADLGHTVGMLAVAAAHKFQQSQLPIRPTFTPPPRVEPAAESPHVDPIASAPSPQSERVVSTVSPHIELAVGRVGPNAPASSATAPTAANQPSARPSAPPPRTRSEAAERARLQEALEDDSDDDIAALADEDDDPMHRRRLAPLTALEMPDDQEDDDDV